jgi:hypothetical protein
MTNCDMVIWQANGKDSVVQDLWSTGRDTPRIDQRQDYVSTYTFNTTHVSFVSDRKINTKDSQDFVIKNVRKIFLLF